MNESRTLTLVGGFICVTAVVVVFVGGFDGGANIGAGLLIVLGVPVAIVGRCLLLIAAIGSFTRRRARRPQ